MEIFIPMILNFKYVYYEMKFEKVKHKGEFFIILLDELDFVRCHRCTCAWLYKNLYNLSLTLLWCQVEQR